MFGKALLVKAVAILLVLADFAAHGTAAETIRYEFVDSVQVADLPKGASTVDLWMPVPSDCEGQKIESVDVVRPAGGRIATEPRYKNRIYYKRFSGPFEKASPPTARLVFKVIRTEIIVPQAKSLLPTVRSANSRVLDVYLRPNRLIPIGGKIGQMASALNLPKNDPLRTGRRLYDYLIDRMDYNWKAPGAGRGDVLWACDSRTGDCSDYHSMFIALCRPAAKLCGPQASRP